MTLCSGGNQQGQLYLGCRADITLCGLHRSQVSLSNLTSLHAYGPITGDFRSLTPQAASAARTWPAGLLAPGFWSSTRCSYGTADMVELPGQGDTKTLVAACC